ncbi:MAG: dodecin family protein [Promethearchaeota archaeon]
MDSVYKFVELVGASEKSWEDAVRNIVKKAAETLRDIRIVEIVKLDVKVDKNEVVLFRAKVYLSFKFEK